MLNLILLFLIITLFVLSFIFLILDLESYQKEKNEDSKRTLIPKRSRYALLFGLLALVSSVILSIGYV
jgi:hypothetical protein